MLLLCVQLKTASVVNAERVESTFCRFTTREGDYMLSRIARKSALDWECCRERLSTQLGACTHFSFILLTLLLARAGTAGRYRIGNQTGTLQMTPGHMGIHGEVLSLIFSVSGRRTRKVVSMCVSVWCVYCHHYHSVNVGRAACSSVSCPPQSP